MYEHSKCEEGVMIGDREISEIDRVRLDLKMELRFLGADNCAAEERLLHLIEKFIDLRIAEQRT